MKRFNLRLLMLIAAACLMFCGAYLWFTAAGPRLCPRGYEHALALISACNRQNPDAVSRVNELIQESIRIGEMELSEARFLQRIIDEATSGDWSRASTQIRKLLDGQVIPAQ